jgi:hypothetical protein
MSNMTKSPATTPIPVQLSGPEFIAFIFPHVWTAPQLDFPHFRAPGLSGSPEDVL